METGTDHINPIHSHFWGHADMGTMLLGYKHMVIGRDHTTPIHYHLFLLYTCGDCVCVNIYIGKQ